MRTMFFEMLLLNDIIPMHDTSFMKKERRVGREQDRWRERKREDR
jgi:hypothetical protein